MGEQTKIEWCDHTFNPWRGCAKVHTGCANCYAETQSKRNPSVLGIWGDNGTRVVAAEETWGEPLKWDRCAVLRCNECGNEYKTEPAPKGCEPVSHAWDFECVCGCNRYAARRPRVFCASLADVFEDWRGPIIDHHGRELWRRECGSWVAGSDSCGLKDCDCEASRPLTMDDLRSRLFALIDATPNLDWLLVTKRPENVRRMWPGLVEPAPSNSPEWPGKLKHRKNVWLLTSVSDQQTADAMIPELLKCRNLVPVLGVSAEPLLGPVDFNRLRLGSHILNALNGYLYGDPTDDPRWKTGDHPSLDWIIVGGESGHGARPCDLAWVRSIVGQCEAAGVACFVKQLGAMPIQADWSIEDGDHRSDYPISDPKGGDWNEWPSDLRVREWPERAG